MVMAGGRGERLRPLAEPRSKPAVPFGGRYRIVDFVLSNLLNSGITSIYVLTQYKAQSLIKHLQHGWGWRLHGSSFVEVVPAQMQAGQNWYRGTADAVRQNIHLVRDFGAEYVAVFGADHIYKMDISQMLAFHMEKNAAATIVCLPVKKAEAREFGIIDADADNRIRGFVEKPADPPTIAGDPDRAYASMGNYIFTTQALLGVLEQSAGGMDDHDFGKHIFPKIIRDHSVFAYDFLSNTIPTGPGTHEAPYWRDVGTIEAFFEANMDLRAITPALNLYNWHWPIGTANYNDPPAKLIFDEDERRGLAIDSILGGGTIISGAQVKRCVVGRNVYVHSYAQVEDSVLFDNVDIGRHCKLRRVIVDKNVAIPPGTEIGYDLEADRKRYHVTESGIVVLPKAPESLSTARRSWS